MSRRLMLTALVFAALLAAPQPAAASWWDWMQEWSGPGPFDSRGNVLATLCRTDFSADDNKPCFYLDYRRFAAKKNDNFPTPVDADAVDAGLTWRLRDSVELGLGVGLMHASGTDSVNRLTVTAPRVVVKPIVLLGEFIYRKRVLAKSQSLDWSRLAHAVKVYARQTIMVGTLEAEDLGVSRTLSSFRAKNDPVTSMGFLIDVGELFGRYR